MEKTEKRIKTNNNINNEIDDQHTENGISIASIIAIAAFGIALILADISLMANASKPLRQAQTPIQTQCFLVQEIGERDFKANACTGEFQELAIREVAYKE